MSTLEDRTRVAEDLGPIGGEVGVLVSWDRMSAEVAITSPKLGGNAATEEDVLAKLLEAGVEYGIEMEAVRLAVSEAELQTDSVAAPIRSVVALGRPPVPGQDARVDFHPSLTEASGRPRVRPDGTVDLLDLNIVRNVSKDEVLASITPPGRGEAGMAVTGAEIPPRAGHDVYIKAGHGTRLSDDRMTLVATVDGCPTLVRGEVAVTDVYKVDGDVGVATGNIQFVGSVVVQGNVDRGLRVKAEGDVEVHGAVDGGHIEASGNVIVHLGITAGSRIFADGSVKARFVESSEVRAGASVWAADGILQSRVEASGAIEVLGRRGAIIGGHVTAKSAVSARVLGSPIGTPTEITVGLSPQSQTEILENRKKRAIVEKEFQRVDDMVRNILSRSQRALASQHVRLMLSKLAHQQEELFEALQQLKTRGSELEQEAAAVRGAQVQAREVCYPGVSIVIGKAQYRVARATSRPCFRLGDYLDIEVSGS